MRLESPREVSTHGTFVPMTIAAQLPFAQVGRRLEEYVRRFQVGEKQTVGIAGYRRAFDFLVFGHLLEEGYVQRQRTVDGDITQLTAVAHLGQQSAFGRRDDVG